jgi:hypothetical protein
MQCPGQDRRYWSGDAAFEVPCPKCGAAVEFFKDEINGRCPRCEHRFQNPAIDLACAKWCAYAEQCIGWVGGRGDNVHLGEGAVVSRLIQTLKEANSGDPTRITQALVAFQHAKEIAFHEGGDPSIVFPAVLLLHVDPAAPRGTVPSDPPGKMLEDLGLDAVAIDRICRTIAACRSGELDTLESKIVWDADILARRAVERSPCPEYPADALQTETGRQAAGRLFRHPQERR